MAIIEFTYEPPVVVGSIFVAKIKVRNEGPVPMLIHNASLSVNWRPGVESTTITVTGPKAIDSGRFEEYSLNLEVPGNLTANWYSVRAFAYASYPSDGSWGPAGKIDIASQIYVSELSFSLTGAALWNVVVVLVGASIGLRFFRRKHGKTSRIQRYSDELRAMAMAAASVLALSAILTSSYIEFIRYLLTYLLILAVGATVSGVLVYGLAALHQPVAHIFQASVDTAEERSEIEHRILASTAVNLSYFTLMYFIGLEYLVGIVPYAGFLRPLVIGAPNFWELMTGINSILFFIFGGAVGPVIIYLIRYLRHWSKNSNEQIGNTVVRALEALFWISIIVLLIVSRSVPVELMSLQVPHPRATSSLPRCILFFQLFAVLVLPSTICHIALMNLFERKSGYTSAIGAGSTRRTEG